MYYSTYKRMEKKSDCITILNIFRFNAKQLIFIDFVQFVRNIIVRYCIKLVKNEIR